MHGIISLGLGADRLIAIDPEVLAAQIRMIVGCFAIGFRQQAALKAETEGSA